MDGRANMRDDNIEERNIGGPNISEDHEYCRLSAAKMQYECGNVTNIGEKRERSDHFRQYECEITTYKEKYCEKEGGDRRMRSPTGHNTSGPKNEVHEYSRPKAWVICVAYSRGICHEACRRMRQAE